MFLSGRLLVLSLCLTACGSARVMHPRVATTLPDGGVTVTPNVLSLACGQSVRLVATVPGNAGINQLVQWSASRAEVVDVDSTGLVHAYAPGTATVMATSVADPRKAGLARVTVSGDLLPRITVSEIVEAGTGREAKISALADSIDIAFDISGGGCLRGALPWVSITARMTNAEDSLTATAPVLSGGGSAFSAQAKIRLNTAAKKADDTPLLHNGSYTLTVALLGSNGATFRTTYATQLTVAN